MSQKREDEDGLKLAQIIKYHLQFNNRNISHPIPVEKISAIGFFRENAEDLTKAAKLYKEIGIDQFEYMQFLVFTLKMNRYNMYRFLLNTKNMKMFVEQKQIKLKKAKIFKYFKKSADFVSSQAAEQGYVTTIDYLRQLIKLRKLANYYVSGKISKYYFAAIPKFPQIVSKLDNISKDEFSPLCNKYEKYKVDVREAMKQENNKVVGVLSYTDSLILEKRQSMLSSEIDVDVPDVKNDFRFQIDPNS